jgi:hypothetical protein
VSVRDGPFGDLRRPGTVDRVVRELLARRAAELGAAPGPRNVDSPTTTLPGSPADVADAAARRSLRTAGLSYRRLRLSARDLSVRAATGDRAQVALTLSTSGYDVVDSAGRVRWRVPPARASAQVLHLVRAPRGWRVESVTAP